MLQCLNNIQMGYFQSGNLGLNRRQLNNLRIRFNESPLSSHDFDLALQFKDKGGTCHYAEDAVTYHGGGPQKLDSVLSSEPPHLLEIILLRPVSRGVIADNLFKPFIE